MQSINNAKCKAHRECDGRYFVLLTYKVEKREESIDTRPVVAGDMGVRKFFTTNTMDGECHTLGRTMRCQNQKVARQQVEDTGFASPKERPDGARET